MMRLRRAEFDGVCEGPNRWRDDRARLGDMALHIGVQIDRPTQGFEETNMAATLVGSLEEAAEAPGSVMATRRGSP